MDPRPCGPGRPTSRFCRSSPVCLLAASPPIIASISSLPREKRDKIFEELQAQADLRDRRNKIAKLFPDEDEIAHGQIVTYARRKYVKHCEFFAAGLEHTERAFMAANRVGKTVVGSYEAAVHLTGEYPHWWTGRRFDRAVDGWAGSDTGETTRDIVQLALMGPPGDYGTGALPHRAIVGISTRKGVTDAVDIVRVKHKSGARMAPGILFRSLRQEEGRCPSACGIHPGVFGAQAYGRLG